VKVHDVQRAVRADTGVDRSKPKVGAGDELGFLASWLLAGDISHSVRLQPVVVHQTDRWLGEKMRAVETVRPCTAVVDARARGGGKHAHPVDLDVRGPGVMHCGEKFLMIRNHW